MAREKQRDRVYLKGNRFYGDFRDYADVGGALTALIPTGQRMATKNRDEANLVATEHLRRLEAARHGRAFGGVTSVTTLAEASMAYLVHSAGRPNGPSESWLAQCERHLRAACLALGEARDPSTIRVTDVEAFDTYLATTALILPGIEGRRGRTPVCGLDSGTRRQYLNTLSKLFKWMGQRGMVMAGSNPVRDMDDKPTWTAMEREFLEVNEVGVYLHAASLYTPERAHGLRFAHALIAVYTYCGLRESEAYQLRVCDVNLQRGTIEVRWLKPSGKTTAEHDDAASDGARTTTKLRQAKQRRLKNRGSVRTLPIPPELECILAAYLTGPDRPRGELLFPTPAPVGSNREAMLTDTRNTLEEVARIAHRIAPDEMKARFAQPELFRTLLFRHTFCAARLQCVDHGMPISRETVQYEMGHGSKAMIDRVYKHLGRIRHRSEHVEYPNPLVAPAAAMRRAS